MTREILTGHPFNLSLTLTMGQAFRWRPFGDGWYSGVLGPHLVHVRQVGGGVEYEAASAPGREDDPAERLHRYFRLDDDIDAIYASVGRDSKVAAIMREYPGLRILRQEPWECMVSQLCAGRTSIGHAIGMVANIANNFGLPLELAGNVRYTFPTAEQLAADSGRALVRLDELRLGRELADNIIAAAQRVCDGELDWDALRRQPYVDVKQRLTQYPGVGEKTADYIALFALDKLEAFPLDKWVWRALTESYPEWGIAETGQPTDQERRELAKRARSVFGEYAGYANQYLFHRRREDDEEFLFGKRRHDVLGTETADEARYEYLARKYLA